MNQSYDNSLSGQTRTVSQKHFSLNFSLIFTHSLWSCDLWSPIWLTYYTVPWKPYVQKTVSDSTSALVLPCSLSRSELLVSTSDCSTLSTWLRHWLRRDCCGWQWSWQMSSKNTRQGQLNLGKEKLGGGKRFGEGKLGREKWDERKERKGGKTAREKMNCKDVCTKQWKTVMLRLLLLVLVTITIYLFKN